jgi:hypothetical protein
MKPTIRWNILINDRKVGTVEIPWSAGIPTAPLALAVVNKKRKKLIEAKDIVRNVINAHTIEVVERSTNLVLAKFQRTDQSQSQGSANQVYSRS